jgi:copper chaperone NosL
MLAYAQANKINPENAHFWAMDFDSQSWIRGEEAHYIISREIHTPMGYGIIAFKNPIRAKEFADKTKGEVKQFKSLFKIDWKSRHGH